MKRWGVWLLCGLALAACGDSRNKAGNIPATPPAASATSPKQPTAEERLKQLEATVARLELENRQLREAQAHAEQDRLQRESEQRRLAQQENEQAQADIARQEQTRQANENYRRYVRQLLDVPAADLKHMQLVCEGKSVPDTQDRYTQCAAIQEALPIAASREASQAAAFYREQVSILSQFGSDDLRAKQQACSSAPYFGSDPRYNECTAIAEALDNALQREAGTPTIVTPYGALPYRPEQGRPRDDEHRPHEPPKPQQKEEKRGSFTPNPAEPGQPRTPPGVGFKPAQP